MTLTKQRPKIELSENQLKVIKDKYLRDDPSVEYWLENITRNIALADLLFSDHASEAEIYEGVSYSIEKFEGPKGKALKMCLLHKNMNNHNERDANFKRYMQNLYKLAKEKKGCARVVEETADEFYDMLSSFEFLPNSPTLMNASRSLQQLSACYVLGIEDSVEGIFDTLKAMALIQKSGGGCISSDARIWTTLCGLEPIEVLFNRATVDGRAGIQKGNGIAYDVRDLHIKTISMNPRTGETDLRKITHVWKFNVAPEHQLVVRTREGAEVQTSDWHPFMVIRGAQLDEVRADCLRKCDVILGPEKPDNYWPWKDERTVAGLNVDALLAWLIGFTLGDGSFGYVPALRQHRLRWFSGSHDVLNQVRSVLKRYGINVTTQRDPRGNCLVLSTLTQDFVHAMRCACGLPSNGPKDATIRIPEHIGKAPLQVVRAFVAGIIDSDGTVDTDGSPSYSTASKEMAYDFAALLSLLGYHPTVRSKQPHGKGRLVNYLVLCCPLPEVNALAADIAPFMANKQRKQRLRSSSRIQTALPLDFRAWRDILKNYNLIGARRAGTGPCSDELDVWSSHGRVNRRSVLRIADVLAKHDAQRASLLRRIAQAGHEIKSVNRAEEPKQYYDLTVADWNTYAAGKGSTVMIHNTGFSFSKLRPRGGIVQSTKGVSSGPVTFMTLFDRSTDVIKQGSTRRGANMGILRYDHPDIMEFITCKKDNMFLENFNISVAIDERFMNAVKNSEEYDLVNPKNNQPTGKINARDVFDRMVKNAWATGDPGYVVIDRINNTDSNPTPHLGQIESTNPCVTGDTLISTEHGLMRMKELVEQYANGGVMIATDHRVPVVVQNTNGTVTALEQTCNSTHLWPISQAFCSGVKLVYKLLTKSGYELEVTADHKIFTTEGKKKVNDIQVGKDKVFIQNAEGSFAQDTSLPINCALIDRRQRLNLPTQWSQELGQVLGWLIGDGWLRDGDKNCRVGFTFSDDDLEVMHRLKPIINSYYGSNVKEVRRDNGVFHLSYHSRYFVEFFRKLGVKPVQAEHKVVPEKIFMAPKDVVVGFLQGLFTSDGTLRNSKKSASDWIALTSKSQRLLKDAQILLANMGIKSRIFDRSRKARQNLFAYTNKKGELKHYASDGILYELGIFGDNVERFRDKIGFIHSTKRAKLDAFRYKKRRATRFVDLVVSIISLGDKEVYDLTEPATHSMICNGVTTTQCGEQPLLSGEPCNLGSINLSKFVNKSWTDMEWDRLRKCIHKATHFLDNVIDVNNYPLPQIEWMAKSNRRIGLGVMGWAETLTMLNIPYNSDEAIKKAEEIMKFINDEALKKSEELGKQRGIFPTFKNSIFDKEGKNFREGHDYFLRNCARTTIAPTGTIAITAGLQGAGIEPFFAIVYVRYNAKGIDAIRRGEKPAEQDTFYEVNPLFEKIAEERNFFGLNKDELFQKIDANHKSLVGIQEIPEDVQRRFLTSHDLTPMDHVMMQVAFQKYTNNAVSKTVNLKNEATEDDIREVYMLGYELGVKGITVYRDGSKQVQILNLKENKADEPQQKVERQKREQEMSSYYEIMTGQGPLHIHVNYDEIGPTKVFANISPTGTEISGMTTTLGILLTKYFELGGDPLRILKHLNSIKGDKPYGFGPKKVDSIPHAISKALREHLVKTGKIKDLTNQTTLPIDQSTLAIEGKEIIKEPGLQVSLYCPKCFSSNVGMTSGCSSPTCYDCGYSECS